MYVLVAAVTAVKSMLYKGAVTALIVFHDDLDPYLPDGDVKPPGSGPLINVGQAIIAILLIIGIVGGLVMTVVALVRALFSERRSIRDAGDPALIALVCLSFSAVIQIVWGVFDGVLKAASF